MVSSLKECVVFTDAAARSIARTQAATLIGCHHGANERATSILRLSIRAEQARTFADRSDVLAAFQPGIILKKRAKLSALRTSGLAEESPFELGWNEVEQTRSTCSTLATGATLIESAP